MSGIRTLGDNKAVIYLLSVLAILLWGMSYIWSDSLISQEVPIFYFVPLRILIAGLILLLFNLLSCNFKPIARKDLWKFMLLSLFEPLVYFLCETYGIKETGSPTISAMIIASVPIVSVIAGCTLFKEKVTFVNVLGIIVTLAGILLVLSSQGEDCKGGNFVLGLVLLVLAVFAEVGHASMTKFLSGDYKPQVIAMYQFLIGSVYLLPFFIFKGLDGFEARYLSWQVLRPMAKSSVFLAIMCIATALVAELIGREHMVLIQWLGIGVAVLGIILSQMSACNREGQGSR